MNIIYQHQHMKKKITALLLFTPFWLSAQVVKRIDGSSISADSLKKRISFLLAEANVTGLAISVFNENKPVFTESFGKANARQNTPLTENSAMVAASFSKMVFSYIAMQLVQDRILDLDKPLVEYLDKPLPGYKFSTKNRGYHDLAGDKRYKKITARMCLTHTTGFPNWRWLENDNKLKFLFEPGSRYRYSGEGLYLLQFVIEKITGKDYEAIAQERVFKPLHMKFTSYIWQQRFEKALCYGHTANGEPYATRKRTEPDAAGSMITTPGDITKFYTALLNGRGLQRKFYLQMTSRQVGIRSLRQFGPLSLVDGTENDAIGLGYGFGVGVLQSPHGRAFFKEANDDGWQHYCIAYPDKKIAVIIMTNSDNGDSIFKYLLEAAIADKYTPWRWEDYVPYDKK